MAEKGPIDHSNLPDFDKNFVNEDDIEAFERAINAPDTAEEEFITALNDWRPVNQKIRKRKGKVRREKDETREGIVYTILKWPLLILIGAWILILSIVYLLTRFYISQYEYWVTWRGKREKLRRRLRAATSYPEWIASAQALDQYLGADSWKESDAFAYYDYATIRRVIGDMKRLRESAQAEAQNQDQNTTNGYLQAPQGSSTKSGSNIEELRTLLEACVKCNFGGIESARLYSQTYHGTKNLLQDYVAEVEKSLKLILESNLPLEEKRIFFKHLRSNFGQSALCLSGGATFAYYHFGVIKALLDANLLPKVVTGTSGGALVAALLCTRTDEELKLLLVPELAEKITACQDSAIVWLTRWWKTGARFDSVDWARRCSWFTRGSMTFKEAYKRTGRILNISCIPSDPHSPSLLLNHITAPDCVIWSATIASAAVPGILNPVVLMRKTKSGALVPFSFGHKWKDGSLRTDIPLRALNRHFNVNFSIVSQVNPHINIFFFSSRGTVGRPVTHRKGKGWRGGFLGSAVEQYLKLDLAKWLKVLRHLELLPRPMSQDWSSLWLQKFDGNITIWPKSVITDFFYILSDPTPDRLANMLRVGQAETFPKLLFISNRLRIERLVEAGRRQTRGNRAIRSDNENQQRPSQLEEYQGIGSTASEAGDSDEGDVHGEAQHAGFGEHVEAEGPEERRGEEEGEYGGEEREEKEEEDEEESGDEDDGEEEHHEEEDFSHEQGPEFVEATGRAIL
ncbi:putative patatin-like phospholipase domain-containing protein [Peziza echinospora]|nr:putative patatin-like phospholipase domain-containing protein [Peziza echinospora]